MTAKGRWSPGAAMAGPDPSAATEDQAWFDQVRVITDTLRAERATFESPLFPMEYIGVQALEAWRRWPEMMRAIDEVVPADVLGDGFRRPGLGVNATHFFSLAASTVHGAERWRALGHEHASDPWRAGVVRDFYRRTAGAWRADGFTTSFAGGGSVRPYAAPHTDAIAEQAQVIRKPEWGAFRRSLAAITQYTFLVNIECRIGIGDTGPYPLPRDRVLVIREIADLGPSWRPWTAAVRGIRHDRLVIGLVLAPAVSVRITDIATTFTTPGSLLNHVEAVALFAADPDGRLTAIGQDDFEQVATDIEFPRRTLYQHLSRLSYSDKLAAGILVYFSMIRPWAQAAGLASAFDWDVPTSSLSILTQLGIEYRPDQRTLV